MEYTDGLSTYAQLTAHVPKVSKTELMRSTVEEKVQQVENVEVYRSAHGEEAGPLLSQLQETARKRENSLRR